MSSCFTIKEPMLSDLNYITAQENILGTKSRTKQETKT
jgi:hypothetical protein